MVVFTDKESLYNDYVITGMSTRDIAKKYNTAQTNVRRLMKYYDIPSRKPSEKTEYFYNKMKPIFDSYKEEYKVWRTKVCEWCGKEFKVDGSHKNNKFCSPECLHVFKTKDRENTYCEICGKGMGYIGHPVRFCNECLSIHKSESQINRIEVPCAYCGKIIFAIPSRVEKNKFLYYNMDCMAHHYAKIYTGENSPNWKGGKKHYTGGWFNARDKAKERDNYTCVRCGITEQEYGQELSVHHIKLYREFEDKVEANQLDNLVCLCEPCHRYVHSNANINKEYLSD